MNVLEKEKAKAAMCRTLTGCFGDFAQICSPCKEYKELVLHDDEYKIENNNVFIKKSAIFREDLVTSLSLAKAAIGDSGNEEKEKEEAT